ncbi:MAG: HEAT repeat domain-containing protein [Planctomycetota bacterium]
MGQRSGGMALIAISIVTWCSPSSLKTTHADEAQWIWAAGTQSDQAIEVGETCWFRKTLNLRHRGEGILEIAADDTYEVHVNGRRIGTGESARSMNEFNISDYIEPGRNVVAIRVQNTSGDTAALVARVSIRPETGDRWYTFSTDETWKTETVEQSLWTTAALNDRSWAPAATFGLLGETAPWDRDADVAVETATEKSERFQIQRGFGVQRLLNDEQVGSIIAMAFDEFGHVLMSREQGPLLIAVDRDDDGVPEDVRTYGDQVESIQGILPLNGEVFVTGDGPDGWGLYRLIDDDRDGELETVKTVLKFDGNGGEHGPHGLRLGPDGMIYIAVGAFVQASGPTGKGETLRDIYEGDLLPRFEDPGGHGRGVKAPGGTIIRTDIEGKIVERVAGGLRNTYDLAFHPAGGLFVHDADMEADVETPWYRPTALLDVTEAAEFGWRTGWAKWPEYYLDRLPNLLDTGRGSPTGIECYAHHMFPIRYHDSLFLADWSEGRILNVRLKPSGSGYVADSEVFLQGQPLNVTDLAVGPDGALYFCTGGRGTAGGVYRVVYQGNIPESIQQLGSGVAAAVRQPQLDAAWARQEIASVRRELGDQWGAQVAGVAYSEDNPPDYRIRAINLMQMFGPTPSEDLLIELSKTENELVRHRVALQLGLNPGDRTAERLEALLSDDDARVRRAACEAILRSDQLPADVASVLPLLADDERTVAFLARQILQRLPTSQWKDVVLKTEDARLALGGMLALVAASPNVETGELVIRRTSELMSGFLSDKHFVDALRLCQVTLSRCEIKPDAVPWFRDQIAAEFPAGDSRMNHELIRLASYLQADAMVPRAMEYLESDAPEMDRLLTAMCLQHIDRKWSARERFTLLKFYEKAARRQSEGAMPMYMVNVTRDFARHLTDEDIQAILDEGARWRNAALAALYRLPRPIDDATADKLRRLDEELVDDGKVDDVRRRLRTGIIAMLTTATDEASTDYLRKIWRTEPGRRALVAMALAQQPEGENWDYLVRSLNILDGPIAQEVVTKLASVPIATDDPMALRALILMGVRAEQDGESFEKVEQLLEHWSGMQRPAGAGKSMKPWQKWYSKTFPDRSPAELPAEDDTKWDLDQLVTHLESPEGQTCDITHGQELFANASCADCHRHGGEGTPIGPDLTSIAKRFTSREIMESILYPSHVVSDQYASKKVLTLDGKMHVGMVSKVGSSMEIRDSNNEVITVPEVDIDQIQPSSVSIMPSGLIENLSLQDVTDLMAFLGVNRPVAIASRPK